MKEEKEVKDTINIIRVVDNKSLPKFFILFNQVLSLAIIYLV